MFRALLDALLVDVPKDQYLLMAAIVSFIGTTIIACVGLVGSMITLFLGLFTSWRQTRQAREAYQKQYQLEELKAQKQAEQEALKNKTAKDYEGLLYLRSKIEEAHQILSKIAIECSQEACHSMFEIGMTAQEYQAQYHRQQEELLRLWMIVELYLCRFYPAMQERTIELMKLLSQFWGRESQLIFPETSKGPLKEHPPTLEELFERSAQIRLCVMKARHYLQLLVINGIPPPYR